MDTNSVEFKDLPKKQQKNILREIEAKKIKPVEPREIENGADKVLKIVGENQGITRKDLMEKSGFNKKKIKRLIAHTKEIKETYSNNVLRLYYL
jgi:predicted HTH transcriptional regulator